MATQGQGVEVSVRDDQVSAWWGNAAAMAAAVWAGVLIVSAAMVLPSINTFGYSRLNTANLGWAYLAFGVPIFFILFMAIPKIEKPFKVRAFFKHTGENPHDIRLLLDGAYASIVALFYTFCVLMIAVWMFAGFSGSSLSAAEYVIESTSAQWHNLQFAFTTIFGTSIVGFACAFQVSFALSRTANVHAAKRSD